MPRQLNDPTAPERVARNKAKNISNGLVRVNIWVPEGDRDRLLKYAERLRNKFTGE